MSMGDVKNKFTEQTAFLIGGGPSLIGKDLEILKSAGIFTFGLNNSVKTFRPNAWCGVDRPDIFLNSLWKDPTIMKFVPAGYKRVKIDGRNVYDHPNVHKFKRNTVYSKEAFFAEDLVGYGGVEKVRSVFLAAVKILFLMGFRRIVLVGVDFKMEHNSQNYSFEQDTSKHAIDQNNKAYEKINKTMLELLPFMSEHGFEVVNTNPKSGLDTFKHVSIEQAVSDALEGFPDVKTESSAGRYELSYEIATKFANKKRSKPVECKKQILLSGISRSGTHALCNWIGSQFSGNVQYRNDLARHGNEAYIHHPQGKRFPARWFTMPRITANPETQNADLYLYSYENSCNTRLEFHNKITSDAGVKTLLLRDPFNLLASCYKHVQEGNRFWFYKNCTRDLFVDNETLRPFRDLWMLHAGTIINQNDILPILYNRWVSDSDYRDEIATSLGVDVRTDVAMSDVHGAGGGSSFDKMDKDGRADEMRVSERWKEFANEPWFKSFFKENMELVEKSTELFGHIDGTEALWQ